MVPMVSALERFHCISFRVLSVKPLLRPQGSKDQLVSHERIKQRSMTTYELSDGNTILSNPKGELTGVLLLLPAEGWGDRLALEELSCCRFLAATLALCSARRTSNSLERPGT